MIKYNFRHSLLFMSLAFMVACSSNKAEESTDTVKSIPVVTTSTVKAIAFSDEIRTTGRLSFNNEYKLSFKTSGIVESVLVEEGQYIKKGTLIASLKLNEIDSKVKQAEIAFNKAKRDFKRASALYADSVATLEQLQNAESQLQNAEMNLQTAQFNLNHSQITAPANGIVQKILLQENEITGAGNPIIIFGAENKGKVMHVNLADADVVKIAVGDKASLKFDAFPDNIFNGKVLEIAGMASPTTGTYEVKIQVNDGNNQLKPGFIGSATIKSSQISEWKEIPIESLVSSDKRNGLVYVYQDGTATKREIRIERLFKDKLIISTGLSAGDDVISSGHHRLTGDHIKVSNIK